MDRRFLSRTREERWVELYEARITALSEDNESLQAQLSELTRTHNASKDQIVKLQEGRTKWQQKCLTMMAKRPREDDVGPGSAKRAAENRPDPEPATSEDITMSPAEVIPSSVGPSHTSNTSDNSNTSNTIHTSNTSSSKLPPPPWGSPLPVEILWKSATDEKRSSSVTTIWTSTFGILDSQLRMRQRSP